MKILVLGYSSIFRRRVLPALEAINQIKSIDVASASQSSTDFSSNKRGEMFSDYELAISQSKAEIVYISLRNNDHAYFASMSLKEGKHVIVDKPAFINETEGEEILNLATSKNLCFAEALLYQYHPQLNQIKEVFAKSNSSIKTISTHFSFPGLNAENFRYKSAFGGGAILDQGPYAMNLGYEVFGEMPIACLAFINEDDNYEVDTSFNLLLKFSEGRSLMGYFGFGTEYINSASFFSRELRLSIDRIYTIPPDFENDLLIHEKNQFRTVKTEKADTFFEFFSLVISQINLGKIDLFNEQTRRNYDLQKMLMESIKNI